MTVPAVTTVPPVGQTVKNRQKSRGKTNVWSAFADWPQSVPISDDKPKRKPRGRSAQPTIPNAPVDTRAYWRAAKRRKEDKRIAKGLCPGCGKRPPAADSKRCADCQARGRNYYNAYKARQCALRGE